MAIAAIFAVAVLVAVLLVFVLAFEGAEATAPLWVEQASGTRAAS